MSSQGAILALALCTAGGALVWGAMSDLRSYTIPNWVSATVALAFIPAALVSSHFRPLDALMGLGLGLGAGLVLFALRWMGGGDVKMFAALSLWSGASGLLDLALTTSIAGAAVSIFMLSPLRRWAPSPPKAARDSAAHPVPYGAAIAAGGLWLLARYARFMD